MMRWETECKEMTVERERRDMGEGATLKRGMGNGYGG